MRRIANDPDFQFGLGIGALALVGLHASTSLRFGTAMRMGPGFVPSLISWLLLATAAIFVLRAVVRGARPMEGPWGIRPIFWVLSSVAWFVLALFPLGLAIAIAGLVLIAAVAERSARIVETLPLAFGLSAVLSGIFVFALGLPIPLLPWMLR